MAAFFKKIILLFELGVLTPQPPQVTLRSGSALGRPCAVLLLEFQSPLAKLVHADTQFTRNPDLWPPANRC